MLKERLNQFACALLDWIMSALAALWELAWLNRRMTAKGIVAAVVFLAARYGWDISPDAQAALAVGITLYLGLVGRDRHHRSIR